MPAFISCLDNSIMLFFLILCHNFHKSGKIFCKISKVLMQKYSQNVRYKKITVHSSEYAVEVYKKLGFVQTDKAQESDGIIFVPIEFER